MAEKTNQNKTSAFTQYGNRLFGFIRSKVPTTADAEDIAQEVWYQFSRVIDTEPIEQVSAWLFRVARNRITDEYRKKKEESLEDYVYEQEDGSFLFNDLLLEADGTPETELFKQVFWDTLMSALEELPQDQRDVFVWNELDKETFQEISDRTSVNIKTLISRKRYAVQHLRIRLQTLYDEFLED